FSVTHVIGPRVVFLAACSSMYRRPATSALFPYTTLFRSLVVTGTVTASEHDDVGDISFARVRVPALDEGHDLLGEHRGDRVAARSEEHTSELQSRENLVCRLLLEKKKNQKQQISSVCRDM